MIYRFDQCELDLTTGELRVDGDVRPVEPQVFALLAFLVEHRERLVTRDEILEKVWDGRIVSDSALGSRIKSARKAVGDDGQAQRVIRTVHGRGLRFVAEVEIDRGEMDIIQPGSEGSVSPPGPENPASTRPSIAVLPFRVIGDAREFATIAEGLPHELITELARLRWLFVIARGSSFRLRSDDIDPREAGRILGARYCVTGTVEVSGQHLTVTTELVDASGGDVVWAERYSGFVDEVHAVRAEIRASILTALEIQIPLHEAAGARLRDSRDLDSWSAYHLGLQHLYRYNRKDSAIAATLFERAIARDPAFARAHAGLSFVHFQAAFMRQAKDLPQEIALARSFAQRGVDIDPLDPFVNFTMGRSYWLEADLDRAAAWLERATSLSPNYAQGIYAQAWTGTMAGYTIDARQEVDLAMRLSPLDPLHYAMLGTRGFIHLAEGEFETAAEWSERAARSPGAHVLIAMIAAMTGVLAGNHAQAGKWVQNVRERNAQLTREDFFRSFPFQSVPMRSMISDALESLGF